jgi:hypothetical protein
MPSPWFCDIYCDMGWVAERNGLLGEPRCRLLGPRSESLGISIGINLYGDESAVRHVRVLMGTEDHQIADACQNINIQQWVAAIEVAVMLDAGRAFHVARLPDSLVFVTAPGQGADDSPAVVPSIASSPARLNFPGIVHAIAAWPREMSQYLFYFRRFIDGSLPLDVRWLNGYRLLEWHFVGDQANLKNSPEWRALLARFDTDLEPERRKDQTNWRLMEQARALAAHAGMDKRSDEDRVLHPKDAMERTFRTLESLVMTTLNEHPAMKNSRVRYSPRAGIA